MNQILNTNEGFIKELQTKKSNPKRTFFKYQFVICSIFTFVFAVYYLYLQYEKKQNEALAYEIVDNFNITSLYENNDNYTANRISNENIYKTETSVFSVVGIIEIKSIGVYYPIINEFSYDLLKIAPCKFMGPTPNEIRKFMYCWS